MWKELEQHSKQNTDLIKSQAMESGSLQLENWQEHGPEKSEFF